MKEQLNTHAGVNLRTGAKSGPGRFIALSILTAAIAWAAYVHLTGPVLPFDDAFITFRYVQNLTDGKGLVYNSGQQVMGFSSPLYLFMLSGLRTVFSSIPIPVLAVRFNLVPFVFTGIGVYLLLHKTTASRVYAAIGSLLILVQPQFLAWSLGGMEAFLFVALMLFALLAAANKRPISLGVLAGLACLARPEGVLILPIALVALFQSKRALVKMAAAFLLTVIPWGLFALFYYGSPIPLSVIAKSRPLYSLPAGWAVLDLVFKFAQWQTPELPSSLASIRLPVILVLVLAAMVGSLALLTYRKRGAWLPSILFLEFLGLYYLGNPMIFDWYLPPVFVCGSLTIMAGLPAIGCLLAESLKPGSSAGLGRCAVALTFAVALAALAAATITLYARGQTAASIIMNEPSRLRIEAYRQAAEMLAPVCSETTTVAAPEIGSLGFYCPGYMLDACGLVSPEALDFLPVPSDQRLRADVGAISTDFVVETNPDYVVTMRLFAVNSLLRSKWFLSNYTRIAAIPLPQECWGSKYVLIFRRKSL